VNSDGILTAHSSASDPRRAIQELHAALAGPDSELILFFCSSHFDLDVVAAEFNRLFPDTQVLGCTTAGEIGPGGYLTHSISGVGFSSGSCRVACGIVEDLAQVDDGSAQELTDRLKDQLTAKVPAVYPEKSFALMLVDGLSGSEEMLAREFQASMGQIPVFGGSAGDDLAFEETRVFFGGRFRSDCAALILFQTDLPFLVFRTQHFKATEERLVVTEADANNRIIHEINGRPATEEYARLIGTTAAELSPEKFSQSPVVVLIDGADYVRSIQKGNPDGSLKLYCAIDEGVVLRVARGFDLVGNLEQTFGSIRDVIGPPRFTLACDCILRSLEIDQSGIKDVVGEVFHRNNTVGFSTYGEQYGGIHVNQTLTGISIGGLAMPYGGGDQ